MKCYKGGAKNYYEYTFVACCFANNAKEAKKLMWKKSHRLSDECDGDWLEGRVVRAKEHDHLLDKNKSEPYIVDSNETLRLMGWSIEGESPCASCDLYPNDIFYLCESCDYCSECGHHEDCEAVGISEGDNV